MTILNGFLQLIVDCETEELCSSYDEKGSSTVLHAALSSSTYRAASYRVLSVIISSGMVRSFCDVDHCEVIT